jgi:hypothetical protein
MTTVTIDTSSITGFSTTGVIRSVSTGRVLATTRECPYGFHGAALSLAREICRARGYVVHKDDASDSDAE